MYTVDDIQFFIQTHNRENLLPESINSLLCQSAGIKEITVLDNESTDNTEGIVKKFADRGVKYVKTFGLCGNYRKAREIVNKPYCMIFHDDDLLHQDYIKLALRALNTHDNVALIDTTGLDFTGKPPEINWKIRPDYYLYEKSSDFAEQQFFLCYARTATAIFRTEDLLSLDFLSEREKYHKLDDTPRLIQMCSKGKCVLFSDPRLYLIRCHGTRDCCSYADHPSMRQLANFYELYDNTVRQNLDKSALPYYAMRSRLFLKEIYGNSIPPDERKTDSFEKLIEMIKKDGFTFIAENDISAEEKKAYLRFQKSLKKKNLIIPLREKISRFCFDIYRMPERTVFTFAGMRITLSNRHRAGINLNGSAKDN